MLTILCWQYYVDNIMLTCGSSARKSRGARMKGASMMIQVLQNTAMKSFNGISKQYHDHRMMITAVLWSQYDDDNPGSSEYCDEFFQWDLCTRVWLRGIKNLDYPGFKAIAQCSLLCLPSVNYVKTVKSNFWIEMSFCVKSLKRLHLQTRSRVICFAHWTLFVFLYLSHFLHISCFYNDKTDLNGLLSLSTSLWNVSLILKFTLTCHILLPLCSSAFCRHPHLSWDCLTL